MPRFWEPRGQRLGLVQVSDVTRPHVHVDLSSNTSWSYISYLIQTIKPVPGECDQLLRMCDKSSKNNVDRTCHSRPFSNGSQQRSENPSYGNIW